MLFAQFLFFNMANIGEHFAFIRRTFQKCSLRRMFGLKPAENRDKLANIFEMFAEHSAQARRTFYPTPLRGWENVRSSALGFRCLGVGRPLLAGKAALVGRLKFPDLDQNRITEKGVRYV